MLDVAIGMIFIYLLMSLLCSAVQELLSSILKLRAKNLQQGIDSLLQDPNAAVASLPDVQMKQSLRIMAARWKGESDVFVKELEQWFDHGMDRASGCFVLFGAPFWFNTLGKALSLRAAGNKPPKGGR